MTPSIRTTTPADAPAICRLFEEGHLIHAGLEPSLFAAEAPPETFAPFANHMVSDPQQPVWVAESEGVVVGFLHAKISPPRTLRLLHVQASMRIETMVVSASARRHGVGSLLVSAAKAWADSNHIDGITLRVFAANEAGHEFWNRMGFTDLSHTMRAPTKTSGLADDFGNTLAACLQSPTLGEVYAAINGLDAPMLSMLTRTELEAITRLVREIPRAKRDRLDFRVCDMRSASCLEQKFDVVLAVDCLSFVDDVKAALGSLSGCLDPTGKLIIASDTPLSRHATDEEAGPHANFVAKALSELCFAYTFLDISAHAVEQWRTFRSAVLARRERLEQEMGNQAFRVAEWLDEAEQSLQALSDPRTRGRMRRYLYIASKIEKGDIECATPGS